MKKTFTHLKTLMVVLFLFSIVFNTNAQDWIEDRSSLYYIGLDGKVYIDPDYDAMAVYFKSDVVSKKVDLKFNEKFSRAKSSSDVQIETMDLKGMIRIKSATSMESIRTLDERKQFLKTYELEEDGAYDILPAFTVGDVQAWFTKRVCIRLNDGVAYDDISEILEMYDAHYIKNITNENTYLLRVENIENQLMLIQELHTMGVLKWGEPDFKSELVQNNDPMYSEQWHLNNTGGSIDGKALVADIDIDAPEAWAITTGVSSVVVAVIDNGVEAHEDMPTLLPGYTPVNGGDGTPIESGDDHGQQAAGLISAQHNNIGCKGIAPGVSIFSVNIFGENTTHADIAEGITWAVDNGADVLNCSFTSGSCIVNSASITDAYADAATNGRGGKGCIILVASGNKSMSCVGYPANLPTVTAVGAISGDGERSNYSNYGPTLGIVAPSDDDWDWYWDSWYMLLPATHGLRTIDREGSNGLYSGNYSASFGGTSGATAQVSAVAALVLSVNPDLTKSEVENILYTTATNMGDANQYGAGIVNAYGAVVAAGGNTVPVADAGGSYTVDEGTAITFDGTGSSDADGDALTYSWDFGDGSNGTGATPSHTYATAGSYIATLTVNDGRDSDQSTASVTVNQPMISAISLSKVKWGRLTLVYGSVTITSNGQALNNVYVEGIWSGGSSNKYKYVSGHTGTNGELPPMLGELSKLTPSFTFTITHVTKAGYFWDTENSQFFASVANTPPVADAGGSYTGDKGTAITFDGTGSSDADGDVLTYSWDFGDGSNGTGATPSHTYATAGYYIATLTVNDGIDSDQSTASVTVDQPMISAISLSKAKWGRLTLVYGSVTITSNGQALSNVYVEGIWSGGSSNKYKYVSGHTGTNGELPPMLGELSKLTPSFTFTITHVTKAGYFWDTGNSQSFASVATKKAYGTQLIPEEFSAYPNLVTNGSFTVAVPELENRAKLVIYDINGSIKLVEQLTDVLTVISVQNFSSGVYILKVEGQDKPQRIIIK